MHVRRAGCAEHTRQKLRQRSQFLLREMKRGGQFARRAMMPDRSFALANSRRTGAHNDGDAMRAVFSDRGVHVWLQLRRRR